MCTESWMLQLLLICNSMVVVRLTRNCTFMWLLNVCNLFLSLRRRIIWRICCHGWNDQLFILSLYLPLISLFHSPLCIIWLYFWFQLLFFYFGICFFFGGMSFWHFTYASHLDEINCDIITSIFRYEEVLNPVGFEAIYIEDNELAIEARKVKHYCFLSLHLKLSKHSLAYLFMLFGIYQV